jgi:hypothetical protein
MLLAKTFDIAFSLGQAFFDFFGSHVARATVGQSEFDTTATFDDFHIFTRVVAGYLGLVFGDVIAVVRGSRIVSGTAGRVVVAVW